MIVVSAMGIQDGGTGVSIEGVYETAENLIVHVLETHSSRTCPLPAVNSAPAVGAIVSRTGVEVEFRDGSRTHSCP
jgi:hypothetical protein